MPNRDSREVLFVSYLLDDFCLSEELEEQYIKLLKHALTYPLISKVDQEQFMLICDYRVIKRAQVFEHQSQIIRLLADLYQLPVATVKKTIAAFQDGFK